MLGLVYRYLRDWTKPFQDLQGENARVSSPDLGATEETLDAGAGLICRKWFEGSNGEEGLWRKVVGQAAQGGTATLEYQLQHPEEADSIHVVNIGWQPLSC